jgi:hypothetical protein
MRLFFFVALRDHAGTHHHPMSAMGAGDIGVAWTEDDPREGKWTYQQVVLHEPFHLSYPFGTHHFISISFLLSFIVNYLFIYFTFSHRVFLVGLLIAVFFHDGYYWMIPEAHQSNQIRLYRATFFPTQWEFVKPLLTSTDVDTSGDVAPGTPNPGYPLNTLPRPRHGRAPPRPDHFLVLGTSPDTSGSSTRRRSSTRAAGTSSPLSSPARSTSTTLVRTL